MKNIKHFGFLLILLTIGCAKTSSDNIKTSGFFAHYSVEVSSTNPTQATCSASYTVEDGSTTYIELSANDTVKCNGNSMSKSVLGSIVTYSSTISGVAPGTSFEVVLTRSGETPYSATVTLPEAVAGTSPANASSGTKGAIYNFSWSSSSNSNDSMYVTTSRTVSGDSTCPNAATFLDSAPENGTGSFSAADMALPTGGVAGACGMKLQWQRMRSGTVGSGLNGRIRAYQTHAVSITLN